jgi:hypothetical protein
MKRHTILGIKKACYITQKTTEENWNFSFSSCTLIIIGEHRRNQTFCMPTNSLIGEIIFLTFQTCKAM